MSADLFHAPDFSREITAEELMDCYQFGTVPALAAGARSDETPTAAQSEGRQSGGSDSARNARKDNQ